MSGGRFPHKTAPRSAAYPQHNPHPTTHKHHTQCFHYAWLHSLMLGACPHPSPARCAFDGGSSHSPATPASPLESLLCLFCRCLTLPGPMGWRAQPTRSQMSHFQSSGQFHAAAVNTLCTTAPQLLFHVDLLPAPPPLAHLTRLFAVHTQGRHTPEWCLCDPRQDPCCRVLRHAVS